MSKLSCSITLVQHVVLNFQQVHLMMRIPMVHTNPIPGCETKNVEFFQKHGMSIGKRSFVGQVRTGEKLLEREKLRAQMQEAQKKNSRPEAAERICKLLEELTGNKENRIIDLEIIQ